MTSTFLSRRRFIKTFSFGTAFSTCLGKPWRATLLAESVAPVGPPTATFKVRVSDYPPLANPFGSVRLGVNPVRPDAEPFPDGDFWPLLINRGENGEFYVLDSECRHASCVVQPYEEFSAMFCPCHGSTYAIDGSILTGPTESPLRPYAFEFDGDDTLTIHIPGLGFAFRATVTSGAPGSRVRLNFDTHYGITYQVHFRPRLNEDWTILPFATSIDGPADQTAFFAISVPASLYVDRTTPTGFYAVSMVLGEV